MLPDVVCGELSEALVAQFRVQLGERIRQCLDLSIPLHLPVDREPLFGIQAPVTREVGQRIGRRWVVAHGPPQGLLGLAQAHAARASKARPSCIRARALWASSSSRLGRWQSHSTIVGRGPRRLIACS